NNGNVRRVGGLEKINEGLGYLENSYTQTSVNNFNNSIKGLTGTAKDSAILANKSLLLIANLPKLSPEHIQAFDLGYKSILFDKSYTLSGNINWNKLSVQGANDIFITGFNTPQWSFNVQFGNREIFKNAGFNVVWKWQDSYKWESPLATGNVPAFNTIDLQL